MQLVCMKSLRMRYIRIILQIIQISRSLLDDLIWRIRWGRCMLNRTDISPCGTWKRDDVIKLKFIQFHILISVLQVKSDVFISTLIEFLLSNSSIVYSMWKQCIVSVKRVSAKQNVILEPQSRAKGGREGFLCEIFLQEHFLISNFSRESNSCILCFYVGVWMEVDL